MAVSGHRLEFGTTGFFPAFHGAAIAKASEDLGFDVQMFSENHSMAADVFGEMRDAVAATERIRLMCGPVNFVTRNPGVIASAIAPIQILSRGRAVCGIARGDSAVAMAGERPQRQEGFERDLSMLRAYLNRDDVVFPDRRSRLEWIGELPYERVPIHVVCSGPKSIALAGRLADEIGLSVGCNPERIGWALRILDEALDRAARGRDAVRVGAFVPIAITGDRPSGRAALRGRVAGWAHMSSFAGNDLTQQPEVMRRVTSVLRDTYDYRYHRPGAPPENPNNAAVDEEFADWFGIGGPPSYLVERLGALVGLGIDGFTTALGRDERELFAAQVMPQLRTLRS
jgi:alkanesulfonate monooxygenase SsuD/methylene tetrahydromethanopterin reductase-like flavin-dependent oxidoreductase (luciferase family)